MTEVALPGSATPRLAVLKALGDNTRYAIYLELARSARPLATAEVAESLDLHPNTVRPHLERMRDVGLLTIETEARGSVGRPQHRYSLAPDAPSLGLEPATFPVLARMLLRDTPVWLLDEPLAHLDAETAAAIGHLLERLSRGRTVLLVSHDDHGLEWMKRRVSLGEAND